MTAGIPLANIEALSIRPGDQGGGVSGVEENLPLTWNSNKTVVFQPIVATGQPIIAKGFTSQSANLQEWQNSGGTVLASIDASGQGSFKSTTLTASSAAGSALTLVAAPSQSADLLTTAGGAKIPAAGNYFIAPGIYATYLLKVDSGIATQVAAVVKGFASQSADLTQWQNSSASVLAKIDASGNLTAASIVKTSGTSAQFLKADGTVDSSTYLTTGTASSTYLPLTGGTISSNLIITGDLTVNGTTTNLNSTSLVIEDKNIVLGDTATPSNTTADGGGITLKGATDKTFNWVNSTGYWTSNVGIEASSFVKTSGTSSQFLKADGSVDSSTYLTTSTASSTYAPIASPSLTGTPLSTTAASSVSSTQIATTAYVKSLFSSLSTSGTLDWNDVSNTRPGVGPTLLLGNATNGPGGTNYYHPFTIQYAGTDGTSNVTQLAIAYSSPADQIWMRGRYSGTWSSWIKFAVTSSPTFTGTPISTTAAVDTNTTQIATTAFVLGQASAADPLALGPVAQGTSLKYSRQDHVHPTTGLALLAGATFTGQIQSTLTGSAANGQLYLNGATSNRIDFNINGVAAPAFTTRSAGTKIVLYPNISGSTVDYAIGIDNSTLWQSVLNSTASFKWYAGTTQVASLSGAGLFSAVSKSFDIQHPTKPDMRLRYGSLEGPENGVYVRGNTKENVIELPEVWTGLVDESTITVSLTSVGKFQKVYVEKIEGNKIYIGGRVKEISYVIFGERKDIDKITVEY
jgi:hypothetical protein